MRRNIKNDKVLRAITIGLAAMITVTGTPVTALANEVGEGNNEPASGESENNTQPEQQSQQQPSQGQQQQQPSIPENVQGATSELQRAAGQIETQKETPEGSTEEQVVGGIDAAKTAAKIIVPNGNGSFITVEKVETTNENGEKVISYKTPDENTDEKNLVNVTDVKSDLEKAEGILLNTKDETTGKDVGIYNDLNELQTAINNFYLANQTLNGMIGEFVEKDENGDLVFSVNNAKYQIVTIPGATENDAPQYMVLKVESTGTTNLANVNEAFDTTIVDANGNDSRAKIQSDNAEAAIEAARNSNNAGNQTDAERYKNSALALIKSSEDEFAIDSQKFEEAAKFANAAKEKLGEIEGQAATVNQRLNDIKNEINDLIGEDKQSGKATALNEQLKAVEAKALALKNEAEKQRSAINQYELLCEIREADKKVQEEVEKNKAEAERIKKAQAEGQELETKIPSISSGNYWKEARKLCYLLVEYYINNGDLAVTDADGNPIALTEGRQLEIGADFEKVLTYSVPDFEAETTTDANGNPMYQMKEVNDDYSITGTGAAQRSKFEFVKKDENGNITGMAYKTIDDKETGMGWIFASSEKSNDCNNNRFVVNIKEDGKIIGTAYFNAKPNDDGSVYIYERTFEIVAGETVEGKEGKPEQQETWSQAVEGKPAEYDYFNGGLEGTQFNENDYSADQVFTQLGEDGETIVKKIVPNTDDQKTTNCESFRGKKNDSNHSYTATTLSKTYTLATENTYVLNTEGKGEKEVSEVKASGHAEWGSMITGNTLQNQISHDLNSILAEYGNEEGDKAKAGYIIEIKYDSLITHKTYTIDNINGKESFWVEADKWIAERVKTSSYEIILKHTEDKFDGVIEDVYQNYDVVTTNSATQVNKSGTGDCLFYPIDEVRRDVNDAIKNAVEALGATYVEGQETYTLPIENGTRTINVSKSIVKNDVIFGAYSVDYSYSVTYTDAVNSTESKLVARNCYGKTEFDRTMTKQAVEAKESQKLTDHKDAEPGYESYTIPTIAWKTDKESQDKAKSTDMVGKANSLKTIKVEVDGKTKTRTINNTSYKDLLAQLDAKDNEVADYDNLYNKVKSARTASDAFVGLLQGFTYPEGFSYSNGSAVVSDLQHGDLTPGDGENTSLVDALTLDNFESTVGALLGSLRASVYNTFEYISGARERQAELDQKIKNARAAVNGIKDTDRFDDDDDDSSSSSTPGTDTYIYAGTDTSIPLYDLTGLTGDTGRGVAGVRTGRTVARGGADEISGVLGVKNVATTDKKVDNTTKKDSDGSKKDSGEKKLTKVENNLVPLADTPFEEGMNMNLLWLLGAAAAAGAGAYAYDKHRKKVAANDEAKKYKK